MSGLLEKLVESWLDSINERGYQSAFCSLLCTEGHVILHNTRHSPIENGKDVITIAPDGNRHLIQLKGNPGRRFKQSDFASHVNQLDMLAALPWKTSDNVSEIPFFVTNGEVEEEARLAFDQYNAGLSKRGLTPVELVARGELLSRFIKSIETIAPSDPEKFSKFVAFLNSSPKKDLDFQELFRFFFDLIDSGNPTKQVQFDRLCSSCFLLAELISSKRDAAYDPYHVILIRTACLSAVMSTKQKLGLALGKKISALYHLFRTRIAESIADFARELKGRERFFLQGTLIDDGIQITFRREVVTALFGALLAEHDFPGTKIDFEFLTPDLEDACVSIVRNSFEDMRFWGEASVARYLIGYFGIANRAGGGDSDRLLLRLLFNYRYLSKSKHGYIFPSAYYSYEEFIRNYVFPSLARVEDSIRDETFWRRSHFFRPVFLLGARKNWKNACKLVWAEFTKYIHADVKHLTLWSTCFRPDEQAKWIDKIYDDVAIWPEVLGEAEEHEPSELVDLFDGDIFLSLVFLTYCPFRMNLSTILTIDRMLGDSINLQDRARFRALRK